LVGTRGCEIIEIKGEKKANVLMRGHYNDELWGLTVNPNKGIFYTIGEDGLLGMWDSKTRK